MKTILFKCILFFAIIIFTKSVNAQEKTENTTKTQYSLEEAIKYAVENGYDVKSKTIDLEIAKKKIWETIAMGLPQVSAAVAYQHTFDVPEMSFGFFLDPTALPTNVDLQQQDILNAYKPMDPVKLGVPDNTTLDVTVSQLIFSGEYIVGLRATKVFREMTEQSLAKSYLDIRESVAISYYLAMVMEENVRTLKETQQITDANLRDLIALGEQGLIEETGVDQVRIIKTNIDNAVNSLNRAAIVSKNLLKFQMGLPIDSDISLSEKIDKFYDESFFTSYLAEKFDITKTLDYQILETGIKIQKLNLDREKSAYLPTLAGFYRHHEQLKQASFNFQPKDIAGINISVPIFASGMKNMKVQQAKLNVEKMRITQEQAIEGLNLQYQNTFNDFQTAFASFMANKQNTQLSKKIFDQTMIKYKEGVASAMDLNTSENQYLTTQRDYFTALNNLLSAKAKLDKLLSKN